MDLFFSLSLGNYDTDAGVCATLNLTISTSTIPFFLFSLPHEKKKSTACSQTFANVLLMNNHPFLAPLNPLQKDVQSSHNVEGKFSYATDTSLTRQSLSPP